ncbi:MAG TPA: hypothetical protein VK530_13880, partial [Candidatus Acidoferrum sp.]|nr:hypothetical protein [Candidatus Acidoferrum sp.]
IVAFFCVSVAETLVGHPVFEKFRFYAAITLAAGGIIGWFVGRVVASRRQLRNEERRFVLFDLRYWGSMLVVLGVITVFIRPLRSKDADKPLAVVPPPRKPQPVLVVAKTPEPPPPAPPKPVVFPALKIQGLIFRTSTPYAIINGQSYTVGDHLGDVVVRAIDRTSVMIEREGEMKVLTLN